MKKFTTEKVLAAKDDACEYAEEVIVGLTNDLEDNEGADPEDEPTVRARFFSEKWNKYFEQWFYDVPSDEQLVEFVKRNQKCDFCTVLDTYTLEHQDEEGAETIADMFGEDAAPFVVADIKERA